MASGFRKKSSMQLQTLERSYGDDKYPNRQKMAKCAESIGLTYNQVKTWFKERRRKEKREIDGVKSQSNNSISGLNLTKVNVNGSRKTSAILTQKKRTFVQMQVLFPKDYILRRFFRKDGPPLGKEFDAPSQRSIDHRKDVQKVRACAESQTAVKKRKVHEAPIENLKNTTSVPKKHGMGKGLMTIWRVTNSQNGEFPRELEAILGRNASFNSSTKSTTTVASSEKSCMETRNKNNSVHKQIIARKKAGKKKTLSKKKAPIKRAVVCKSHSPAECELSADGAQLSEGQDGDSTLVDDEELELRELQSGPNPLRCSAHLSSSGQHGCALCKDLLARFPPPNVKMKQPFSARPWDCSPELVKKLFKVLRFLYANSTRVDVHPFTIDEFAKSFHDKDSMLLGKVHMALLKLLLSDAEKAQIDNLVPFSSKDSRFLSFLNFFREQELDVSFLIKSLNPLTWIEILRQVLVAAGFGSKDSLLRRSFSKEKNQMVKYGLRPRTLKGELFTALSKIGSSGLKVSDLAKFSLIIELNLPNSLEETEQLIHSILSSDITLFEKISHDAYRLRVDPRIKGTNPKSDSEDSGSVEDEESRDSHSTGSSSSSDESDCSDEISSSKWEGRIAKYREVDESYHGEAWVLGLMEGEYSDLRVDEKLDALVVLVDLVGGASSCLRVEELRSAISATAPTLHRFHASGGKIKKSTYSVASSGNKVQSSPSNTIQAPVAVTNSCEVSSKMQTVPLGSDRRYNNYWLFVGPCARDDPGHRMVFFESSEDGHWEVIDTPQDLLELLSVLDTRGTRESSLFASLNKRQSFLCQLMEAHHDKSKGENMTQTSSISVISNIEGSSPISDIDNNNSSSNTTTIPVVPGGALVIQSGKAGEEKNQKWERLQEFDKWVWDSFYLNISAVRCSKRLLADTWARCQGCHHLYWREEKHCRICHSTFELDFEQEERYAMHLSTCKEIEGMCELPNHRVYSSQLQALKAAIHAIEAAMPDVSLVSSWVKSAHKLWVNRLQRTSSLPELLQVLADFVGAIDEDWLYECAKDDRSGVVLDDLIVYFQTMPQTSSALALWVVRLDSLISSHLQKSSPEGSAGCVNSPKRKQLTCNR